MGSSSWVELGFRQLFTGSFKLGAVGCQARLGSSRARCITQARCSHRE